MDWVLIIVGSILMIIGMIGCIVPVIPGPPISFLGLLSLHFTTEYQFTTSFLIVMMLLAAAVTVLDYYVPIYGTKKFGGSNKGVWGSMIGLVLGLIFFPPFGIIIGPFLGAFIGELIEGKNSQEAMKSSLGSFIGLFFGTILKLISSSLMIYYFIIKLF